MRRMSAFRKFRRSLYGKLVLIVALACIPAFILAVWMNYISFQENRKRALESIDMTCRNKFLIIEDHVRMLRISLGELVNNANLQYLSLQSDFSHDVFDNIKALEDTLKTIHNGNRFAEDIEVFLPTLNRIVSYRCGTFEFDNTRYRAAREVYTQDKPQGIHDIGGVASLVITAPFYNPDDDSQILILAHLSLEEVRDRLNTPPPDRTYSDRLLLGGTELKVVSNDIKGGGIVRYANDDLNLAYEYVVHSDSHAINLWKYMLVVSVVLLLIVVMMVVSAFLLNHIVVRPIRRLVAAFDRMETGDLDFELDYDSKTAEYNYLFTSFNRTLHHMNRLINDAYEDGLRLKTAKYKQLAHQIQPHFLYNCLHIINCMTRDKDMNGIRHMTQHLTAYFKSLAGVTRETATLQEEYDLIHNYIQIQTVRFNDRIHTDIQPLPPELAGIHLPHLSLQPLVENVYTHGLKNCQENGVLSISFEIEEKSFCLIVEDNGADLSDELLASLKETLRRPVSHDHMALVNVHHRIQLMKGDDYGLDLQRSRLGGLKVVLRFPKQGEEV